MSIAIAIEQQGRLFALANRSGRRSGGGTRGSVSRFTSASRLRLMRKTARLAAPHALFMTLTYPDYYPHPMVAKVHLHAFLQRMKYHYPNASCVWRMEPQKRGAPHFHLMWFNVKYIYWKKVQKWWARLIAEYNPVDNQGVDLQFCDNPKMIARYISKYIAKLPGFDPWQGAGPDKLGSGSYLHAGRWWGVHNAACIPYAIRQFLTLKGVSEDDFERLKCLMRQEWEGLNDDWCRGGVVFTEDGEDMLNIALCILSDAYSRWNYERDSRTTHPYLRNPTRLTYLGDRQCDATESRSLDPGHSDNGG